MRVFITGGTGFIGSGVIKELLNAGHEVVGLARSEKSEQALAAMGATAMGGSLEDLDSLKRGAESADAVIHCGFVHDFANFAKCCETDKRAIEAIGKALTGTSKPFIVTSGVPVGDSGQVVTENTESENSTPRVSEQAALPFAERGVRVTIVRPSRFVHGHGNYGFASMLIDIAGKSGAAVYVGDGANRIHAVHRDDLAKLYLLALEKGGNGVKYQAVGECAILFKEVAEAIGKRLNVPTVSMPIEQAMERLGMLGGVIASDNPASSGITQTALGWKPTGLSLLQDLE
ncbi:MAG: SDR family oxidoreductase [Clostridiales bacterium]|jgi:nucleoside-diphosphate-sugar epimerase|nr:SDR family oxidoreductase [Clostridiales bacterium]